MLSDGMVADQRVYERVVHDVTSIRQQTATPIAIALCLVVPRSRRG
jgi:hypothetical protein